VLVETDRDVLLGVGQDRPLGKRFDALPDCFDDYL